LKGKKLDELSTVFLKKKRKTQLVLKLFSRLFVCKIQTKEEEKKIPNFFYTYNRLSDVVVIVLELGGSCCLSVCCAHTQIVAYDVRKHGAFVVGWMKWGMTTCSRELGEGKRFMPRWQFQLQHSERASASAKGIRKGGAFGLGGVSCMRAGR
jgi:hypothetical protein